METGSRNFIGSTDFPSERSGTHLKKNSYMCFWRLAPLTVDKLISKTIIVYVSVITVPKNVTCHFNLRHMISVHVSALF